MSDSENERNEWWCLDWFNNATDKHVGREIFSGLSSAEAKEIFGYWQEYLADVCDVKEEHRVALQRLVKHHIDLEKYNYEFSACAMP